MPQGQDSTRDRLARIRRPWLPACLAAHGLTAQPGADAVDRLTYLVLEEVVEGVAVLTAAPWPAADGHGRLRFPTAEVPEVAIAGDRLERELYEGWLDRSPRIGDVFAAPVDATVLAAAGTGLLEEPLARLLPGPVHDITAEARKVAKLALYAVRSDILDLDEAVANDMAALAVRDDVPAPRRTLPPADPDAR